MTTGGRGDGDRAEWPSGEGEVRGDRGGGGTFLDGDGDLFIRGDEQREANRATVCTRISDGYMIGFGDDEMVLPVKAKVVILEG